jgi:hypothetical protein
MSFGKNFYHQRGHRIMAQGLLPFQYEVEEKSGGMTALAGFPAYVELSHALGLGRLISQHVKAHGTSQGWTDEQIVTTLVWLNICGGECVDDLRILEADEGLCRFLRQVEHYGRTSSERRALKRRWRIKRSRTVPCATAGLDYLRRFHDKDQEEQREPHKAFIPQLTGPLIGLVRVAGDFIAVLQRWSPEKTATLDMDATLVETYKRESLYCYKKHRAYQPLNIYWFEQGVVLHSEFRDGNVPADYDLLRPFLESLDVVPQGVIKIFLRSDTAGYVIELLQYCAEGRNKRFGVIEFAVGADVTQEFKKAVAEVEETAWERLFRIVDGKRVETGQEYAEVCFVPSWVGHKKDGPMYRYLAIREPLSRETLPKKGQESKLPFQTTELGGVRYKITAVVTNREIPGDELIWWYRERCGKSEEAHSIMKEDLAGGKFPSGLFGANAAWWHIMILAFNLNAAMKRLVLGGSWLNRRLKAIRFHLINVPGRVLEGARTLVVRLVGGHPSNEVLLEARRRMLSLCRGPG